MRIENVNAVRIFVNGHILMIVEQFNLVTPSIKQKSKNLRVCQQIIQNFALFFFFSYIFVITFSTIEILCTVASYENLRKMSRYLNLTGGMEF